MTILNEGLRPTSQHGVLEIQINSEVVTTSPREDFFEFVNGEWNRQNPIPPHYSKWGTFYVLCATTIDQIQSICQDAKLSIPESGSNSQIVADFYSSGIDIETRDRTDIGPIRELLGEIDEISSSKDIQKVLAKLHLLGFYSFFQVSVQKDKKDPDTNMLYVHQADLGMPDRDYYLEENEFMQKVRTAYKAYMVGLFRLAGYSDQETQRAMESAYKIEHEIARISLPKEKVAEEDKNYHKFTPAKANRKFTSIDWVDYLKDIGAGHLQNFNIQQPEFMAGLDKLFQEADIEDVKQYMAWIVLNEASEDLGSDFVAERFNFYGKVLEGIEISRPIWRIVIQAMQNSEALAEALGPLYVSRHFPEGSKELAYEIAVNVTQSFKERVKNLAWMDEETKKLVYKKVDAIAFKLGYPEKWGDLSGLDIGKNPYIVNVLNLEKFEFQRRMQKAGRPVDVAEWENPAVVVNAWADYMREITFPAAILQDIYFDPEKDMAHNYAGFGFFVGHELTHFVDNEGSKYEPDGKLHDWWPKEVKKAFKKGSKAFIKHYSRFSADGVPVNAEFTLAENIADVAGLTIAFEAYMKYLEKSGDYKIIDGLTPEQRFFIAYAKTESETVRPERRKKDYKDDPHSPSEARVNAVLSIMPAFHKAFGVKPGDKMYVPPKDIPVLW